MLPVWASHWVCYIQTAVRYCLLLFLMQITSNEDVKAARAHVDVHREAYDILIAEDKVRTLSPHT